MKKNSLLLLLICTHLIGFGRDLNTGNKGASTLVFQENKGQIRDQKGNPRADIDFILQASGMTLYVGKGQLHYQFAQQQEPVASAQSTLNPPPKHYQVSGGVQVARIDVNLKGSNKNSPIQKEGLQEAKYHYYTDGSTEGITGVSAYNKIIYKNVYPHIDWVLYTDGSGLKYDFIVHPGGVLSDIQLEYTGAKSLQIEQDGSLKVEGFLGNLTEAAPYIYEQQSKQAIKGKYVLNGHTLTYQTGTYTGTLVVDPGVEWSTYFGGTGTGTSAQSVSLDDEEHVYVSGLTSSTNNIATTGAHQTTFSGASVDGFLAKFDSTGTLLWATYYGGPSTGFFQTTQASEVACDNWGNVYIAGLTSAESGIATPGSYQATKTTNSFMNGFLARFNSEGIRQWGTYYGANLSTPELFVNTTYVYDLACDNSGNVYIGGLVDSVASQDPNFVTTGAHQTTFGGGMWDGWLAKFDSSGSRGWATYFGGEALDQLEAIVCDDSNNVYISGGTGSAIGIATPGTHEDTFGPNSGGGFLSKFDGSGVQQWGTYLRAGWAGISIALDSWDNLYVGSSAQGNVADTFIYTPGCHLSILEENSQYNGVLMQFNRNNGTRNWGTYYGAENPTIIQDVATNDMGDVFIIGNSNSYAALTTETIATSNSHQDTLNAVPGSSNPNPDAIIVQFDSTGERKWATYFGGTELDNANGIAISSSGAIYVVGESASSTAIASPGAHQSTLGGDSDAFLTRWLPVDISLQSIISPGNDTLCSGETPLLVQVKNQGRIDKLDDLIISYSLTGPDNSSEDLTFAGGLMVGVTDTFDLGSLSLNTPGEYELLVYLQYTQDDNDRNNDTIHQTLIVTNAEPLANIQVNQVGSIFHFSNASAQPSDTYLWDFGDGNTSTEANPSHEYAQTQQYLVTLIVTGFCGSDTATVEVDGVSIQENYLQKEIAVYPNPTNQMLHLKLGTNIQAEFFTVYNVLGQEVLSGSLVQTHQINVSHLAGGSYVIQIKTNKGNVSKQFQVVR